MVPTSCFLRNTHLALDVTGCTRGEQRLYTRTNVLSPAHEPREQVGVLAYEKHRNAAVVADIYKQAALIPTDRFRGK